MNTRSWLFAPADNDRILARAFESGADAVILDLEDSVPRLRKDDARRLAAEVLRQHHAWVRVNAPRTPECAADLAAVAGTAAGIRVPKTESAADVAWVAERIPGLPIACTVESARGVTNARDIAESAGVVHLVLGASDLRADLGVGPGPDALLFARGAIVIASRAARISPPVDGAYTSIDDASGLEVEARHARALGFFGKSAIHPRQVPIINAVFAPTAEEVAWAERVVRSFEAAGRAATRVGAEMVDEAVARRARSILESTE